MIPLRQRQPARAARIIAVQDREDAWSWSDGRPGLAPTPLRTWPGLAQAVPLVARHCHCRVAREDLASPAAAAIILNSGRTQKARHDPPDTTGRPVAHRWQCLGHFGGSQASVRAATGRVSRCFARAGRSDRRYLGDGTDDQGRPQLLPSSCCRRRVGASEDDMPARRRRR